MNIFSLRITAKNEYNQELNIGYGLFDYEQIYLFNVNQPYSNYKYALESKFYCTHKNFFNCIDSFCFFNELLKDNIQICSANDNIFSNYVINMEYEHNNLIYIMKYTKSYIGIGETRDYQSDDKKCDINCPKSLSCFFEQEKNLYNPKCNCDEYHYGIDCKYKYYCNNCVENKCKKNNKCDQCKKGWSGPNCNEYDCISLQMCKNNCYCKDTKSERKCVCDLSKNETSYIENTIHTTNDNFIDNSKIFKESKTKIYVGASFGILSAIAIFTSLAIYLIKWKRYTIYNNIFK